MKAVIKTGPDALWNRQLVLLCAYELFSSTSVQMANTTIAGYAVWLGMASGLAGILSGVYFTASIFTRPFSGLFATRFDKRAILLAASGLMGVSAIGLLFTGGAVGISILRMMQGAGYSIATTTAMAAVAAVAPPERMGQAIGVYGLSTILAQMLAPALAFKLVAIAGYTGMQLATIATRAAALVCLLLLGAIPDPYYRQNRNSRVTLSSIIARESFLPAILGLCFSTLNSSVIAFMGLYARQQGIGGAEYFFICNALAMLVCRAFASRGADTVSLATAGLRSGALLVASMLLLGFGHTMATMLLAGVFFGAGYGSLLPITQSRAVRNAPPGKQGAGSNTYFLGIDGGFMLGSYVAGFLAGAVGYANMYLCLVVPAAVGMGIAAWRGRGPH